MVPLVLNHGHIIDHRPKTRLDPPKTKLPKVFGGCQLGPELFKTFRENLKTYIPFDVQQDDLSNHVDFKPGCHVGDLRSADDGTGRKSATLVMPHKGQPFSTRENQKLRATTS